MTLQLQLDDDGDLNIPNDNMILGDFLEQRINTALRLLLGEWFLDTSKGVPYQQKILVKNPNLSHIRSALRAKILEVEGVLGIQSLDLNLDRVRRKLRVTMMVVGPNGTVQVNIP